jgi:hypothetical protein
MNERFLKVGYKKRDAEGSLSPKWKRPFMGRKGIGKLSVFSIADKVAVYSVTESSKSGLKIEVEALRAAIKDKEPYYPPPLSVPEEYSEQGTAIVLTKLKSQRVDLTVAALRKRLARRFSVIDQKKPEEGGFEIVVNGNRITYADREELKRLEFIWEFGTRTLDDAVLPADIERYVFSTDAVDAANDWRVRGWIGTAKRPTDLTKDEDAGSLKNIIVLARKRPIQEGIIEKLDFSRIFGNYVTGQIEADFLDLDGGYEDIATSDRQRLIEDDPRVVALQKFLRERFLEASEQWTVARPKKKAKDALDRYPKLREWVESRPPYQREPAHVLIGTIAGLEFEGTHQEQRRQRAAMFRSGVLAFERVGLRQSVDDLKNLSTAVTAADLLAVLANQDFYESGLWVDILQSRVVAISGFRDLTSANEKEKVLQLHLFNHLWMLDAGWERATGSARMEEDLRRVAPGEFAVDEKGKEIRGRIDIRYATAAGKHIIVELKRYDRKVDISDLVEQGTKYVKALVQVLKEGSAGSPPSIEVVFILGDHPTARDHVLGTYEEYIANALRSINGRYVLYDELIRNARNQYSDYLAASDKAKELSELLGELSDLDLDAS